MSTAPAPPPAADPVADLHRSGRLLAEYRRLPALLRGLGDDELQRAGRLLTRLSVDEVLARHPEQPVVSVAVTGHGTVAGLVPPLTAQLARHGLLLRPHVADFGGWLFDLADPASEVYAAGGDLVVCVLDADVVFDEVPRPWRPEDVARVLAEKVRLLDRLAATHASAGSGTLVYTTLPLPREFPAQLADHRSRARLGALWREGNARLLGLMEEHPGLVVLDLDQLLTGPAALGDARLAAYTGTPYTPELTAALARELGHLVRGRSGRAKKVLAVDLDGTLWGGVLGDDGPEGIEVAGGRRGRAFRRLQRALAQLASRGVLLAAVSKNDLEPVRQVLREHPEMTLREDDFVRVVANWEPKHGNLRALAEDLNLGLDSLVFVDDSAYECGLVARELPEVTVLHLDGDPALHTERVLADGWFDVRDVTEDDVRRPARYREELVRKDFLDSFASLDDYLRELEVRVELSAAGAPDTARLAQLTQRTNQFNLTTRRLQQDEIRALAGSPEHLVLALRCGDRFGDNGLVGAVFVRTGGPVWHIENFLLSCRVFARGIEQGCLAALLEHARAAGAEAVEARYTPSAKNGKVKDFYPRNGFAPSGHAEDGSVVFRHTLRRITAVPGHLDLTAHWKREGTP
ncbi:HAD-IIIC family phosphatase [Streptomyces sp. NPDC091377]|uniref:HAD-IIIC family phosphatase n=1 Tax=Streptomyces sp. NPDC091377 TaxID=3365995 RepID=UPI00382F309D